MMSAFVMMCFAGLALVYVSLRRSSHPSLSKIRGPKSSSFLLGNLLELFQCSPGQTDLEWQRLYGDVIRFKTVLGGDELLVADPKALHRIFNTSSYSYPKRHNMRILSRMVNGSGITWAEGEDHKRQRKVLLPGFGGPESKAFLSTFRECAESVCMKWMEVVGNSTGQKAVLNIRYWLSRGTLDAIGQAAFDVQFGTVQNNEHPLARVYNETLSDIFGYPSALHFFILAASKYIPTWILEWMADHGPNPRLERAREVKEVATEIARELVREKYETISAGMGSRDIFTSLTEANMDAEAKNKLTEEELLSQMRTILLAGHEPTSNTLCWILLELARHPKTQSRLRDEIRGTEAAIRARGDTQFTTTDFDAMPYTTAVIKEGLRYHAALPHIPRVASKDDILPLARPLTTESGEVISEIVIPQGTQILASIFAYNRNKELWGEDAHEFNPDRWLDGVASGKKSVSIGVYSNLMTFLSGARSCLGWRVAVIEIQAFLVEMINRFEFTMTDRSERICQAPGVVVFPIVEGEIRTWFSAATGGVGRCS